MHALLAALRHKRPAFGAWLTVQNTFITRTIVRASPELSWICIDCEHGLTSLHPGAAETIAAIESASSNRNGSFPSPLVRIPSAGGVGAGGDGLSWQVKYALDAGARGVIAPMINTISRAEEFAKSCRFPPLGRRGYGNPFTPSLWGTNSASEYIESANEQVLAIAQVETREAVNNSEAVIDVDGIDVLFIGPYDLSLSLGHTPPELPISLHPEVEEAVQHVKNATHKAGKHVAIYCTSGEQAAKRATEGFDMINVVSDVGALADSLRQHLSVAKTGIQTATLS